MECIKCGAPAIKRYSPDLDIKGIGSTVVFVALCFFNDERSCRRGAPLLKNSHPVLFPLHEVREQESDFTKLFADKDFVVVEGEVSFHLLQFFRLWNDVDARLGNGCKRTCQ